MGYRLYILSIRDLLDEKVRKTALEYIDSHRKILVEKYKKHDDQLRAIAAGLLLQVGFLELEVGDASDAGDRRLGTGDDMSSAKVRLEVREVLALLANYADKHAISLPVPLTYEYGTHGKPAWERRCIDEFWGDRGKKYPHFNLSHSGDYVVLAISETPIGVDIQTERECDYPGGYKAFSRMEAFVKCTGEGIAHGKKAYEEMGNSLQKFDVFEVEFLDRLLYNIVVWRVLERRP